MSFDLDPVGGREKWDQLKPLASFDVLLLNPSLGPGGPLETHVISFVLATSFVGQVSVHLWSNAEINFPCHHSLITEAAVHFYILAP